MSFKARFQPHRGFLFFLVLSVTRPSPSLGQVLVGTLNHATCNVNSPIGREITTVLKIAVGSVSLELCDSHDSFASSLLVNKTE